MESRWSLRGNLSGLDSVGKERGNASRSAVPDEDLKKNRETGQESDTRKSGQDLSILIVLGVSAIGGLVAFCAIFLVLGLIIRKRKKRSIEAPVESEAPIMKRNRTTRRNSSAGRLSLLVNRVHSSEARLGQLELLVKDLEQLSPQLSRKEHLLVQKSSETTRVSNSSSLSSFQSRRKDQRDHLDKVAQSKRGGNTFASVTPTNLHRARGCEDLHASTVEMMSLITPRRASEYLGASVPDYQVDGFEVSLETLGNSVDVGSDRCSS